MKKKLLIAAASLLAIVGIAQAGFIQPAPVVVDLVTNTAFGDQLTARTSDNDVELIGCGTRVFDDGLGGTFSFGFCQAVDSAEVTINCSTTNPGLVDAMEANNSFAFITFSWNEFNECTRVGFSTQSFYLADPNEKPKDK